jgi:hypothetical protein
MYKKLKTYNTPTTTKKQKEKFGAFSIRAAVRPPYNQYKKQPLIPGIN